MLTSLLKYASALDQVGEYEIADQLVKLVKIAQQIQPVAITPTATPQIQALQNTLNQVLVNSKKTEQRQDGTIARLQQQIKNLQNQIGNAAGAQAEILNDNNNQVNSNQQQNLQQNNQNSETDTTAESNSSEINL